MKRLITLVVIAILGMGGVAYACIPKVVDACSNIDSVQQAVPAGYHLVDDTTECVPDEVVVTPPAPNPEVVVSPAVQQSQVEQAQIEASPPIDFGK